MFIVRIEERCIRLVVEIMKNEGHRTLCFSIFSAHQHELDAYVKQIECNDNNFICLCLHLTLKL